MTERFETPDEMTMDAPPYGRVVRAVDVPALVRSEVELALLDQLKFTDSQERFRYERASAYLVARFGPEEGEHTHTYLGDARCPGCHPASSAPAACLYCGKSHTTGPCEPTPVDPAHITPAEREFIEALAERYASDNPNIKPSELWAAARRVVDEGTP